MFAIRLAICVAGLAVVFSAPNERAMSPKGRDASGSEDKLGAVSVPLSVMNCGSNDQCYRIDVSLGTPPRPFRLTLDNNDLYDSIHVFSSNLTLKVDKTTPCKSVDITRNLYDRSASSSFRLSGERQGQAGGKTPYYPYEDPKCTKTQFGFSATGFNDTLKIGSASVPNVSADLITVIIAPLSPVWVADGWFSVSVRDDPYDIIRVLTKAFEKPLMTLYFARVDYFDQSSNKGGVLTIGGANTVNCDSKWTQVQGPSDADLWNVVIQSLSIKGSNYPYATYSQIDLTTTYMTAPRAAIQAVVSAIGAEYDFKTDTYQVDCNKRASFPDMVFKLQTGDGDLDYRLPGTDFARKLNSSDRRCTLVLKAGDDDLYWTLGTTFFRPYCTLVDVKKRTLSIAKVLH